MAARCYDVIVIGAGPAGSTTARELAEAGFDVLLLEGQRLPRNKPCGGGLTPRAWPHLGVAVEDLVLNRATSVQVRVGTRVSARFRARSAAVWMVRRRDLDLRLAEKAARRGVELHDGEMARRLEVGPTTWVSTEKGRYQGRVVVGADGAESRVARWLGLPRPNRWMVALAAEVEVAGDPLAGEAVVDLAVPHGYAWVFPKGECYNVGTGTFQPEGARELRWRLHRFADEVGLSLDRPLWMEGHRIPTGLAPGDLHRENVLLVGDATGVADPFFGEGMSYALQSGRLAARTATEYLAGRSADVSSYTRRVRAALGPDAALWRVVAILVHRFPAASLRILAASRRLQLQVERTVAGEVSLGDRTGLG